MKRKKIIIFIILVTFIILYNIKSNAIYNTKLNDKDLSNAIQETAAAYFRKRINIQYESMKRDYLLAPEEATVDRIIYSTCHTFAYQIYKQAFNLNIPKGISETYEYCKIKQGTEYVPIYYPPKNFQNTQADYTKESPDYKSLLNAFINGDKTKDQRYLDFINQLKVGDIISQSRRTFGHTSSHTMIVYDFVIENGKRTDCYVVESTYSSSDNMLIKGGIANKREDKLEMFGSIHIKPLSVRLQYYANNCNIYRPLCLVVFRPLGNTGEKYCNISMEQLKKHNENNNYNITEENQKIECTSSCESRLKYPGIDISKVSNRHNNSVVGLGDKITYTVIVKNNSNKKISEIKNNQNDEGLNYKGIEIKEYIDSNLVELIESNPKQPQLKNYENITELIWNNLDINCGETKKITYTVKVKNNIKNLNKEIKSKGKIDNIQSSTITNNIGVVLSNEQKDILKKYANKIDYTKYDSGIKLISDLYKKSLGVDIQLNSSLRVSDIIKTNTLKDKEIINDNYRKIILNDFYGTWIASNRVKEDNRYYIWGTAKQEVDDQEAKTVLKGNLNIGDIILIENNKKNTAYVYLGDKIIGAKELINGNNKTHDQYDVRDNITKFLADLVSKDGFVILSPALAKNSILLTKENRLREESQKKYITKMKNLKKIQKVIY